MQSFDRVIRGIPLWLLREYLEAEGGSADGDVVTGEGWRATLTQVNDHPVGSLRIGQVRLVIEGNAAHAVAAALGPKLLRAGG